MAKGIDRIVANLVKEVADLKRRMQNVSRSGRVTAVDAARGRVKIDVGDDEADLETPWVRWTERAGARKTWNPPSVGELMTVLSPGGEVSEDSLALHGGFTDDNPPPSADGDATAYTLGPVTITIVGAGVTATVGGVSFALTAAGTETTGGAVTHNGTDIGDTHTHGGIMPGMARTDTPQ